MHPCCRTLVTALFSDRLIMSEPFPEYRNLNAVQEQTDGTGYENRECQNEEESLVPLHLYPQKVRWLTIAPPVAAIARTAPAQTNRGVSNSTAAINSIIPDPIRPETSMVLIGVN